MKKILFSLIMLFIASSISAQVVIYEYKDDKTYCTFELDTEIQPDSTETKGTYRAYKFYDIPYFEMTFSARSYISETGETVIAITPNFYYHSYLSKLIGQREVMNPKEYKLLFALENETITPITSDEDKSKVYNKSSLIQKISINPTKFPLSFSKARTIDWKMFPKNLRKSLNDKDKEMGRRYK